MCQCTLHFSTSYQIMNHKMNNSCPASNKLSLHRKTEEMITLNKKVAGIKPDKLIIGRIIISKARCPKILDLWLSVKIPKMTASIYKFQMDTVLRLNVTFVYFELLKPKKIE